MFVEPSSFLEFLNNLIDLIRQRKYYRPDNQCIVEIPEDCELAECFSFQTFHVKETCKQLLNCLILIKYEIDPPRDDQFQVI